MIYHDGNIMAANRGDDLRGAPFWIDVDDSGGIDKAYKLLSGLENHALEQAVGSAIKRAAMRGRTVGAKLATERYAIGQNVLKRYTKWYNHKAYFSSGSFGWVFGYRGYLIPLSHYDTTVGSDGRVHTRVLKTSPKKILDHAFRSTGMAYNRIRERVGQDRYPTRELFGPSPVEALILNEDKVESAVLDEFDQRIDHEILRILNGWGI